MNTTLVNLAQPVVVSTIDYVLEDYPSHPYQQAFASPELRQKLVAQVLNDCTHRYITVPNLDDLTSSLGGTQRDIQTDSLMQMSSQRQALETLIRRLIEQVLQDNWDWVERHIPIAPDNGESCADWFG